MTSQKKIFRSIWTHPVYFVACGFGAGASPFMPGTCGTLVAIPIFMVLAHLPVWLYLPVVLILLYVGRWLSQKTCDYFGRVDHPAVVIDEIVGYLITMFAIPATWYYIIIGFLLFRLFDIWKPWPITLIEKHLTGGWAVMLDDVVAGLVSWLILFFLLS